MRLSVILILYRSYVCQVLFILVCLVNTKAKPSTGASSSVLIYCSLWTFIKTYIDVGRFLMIDKGSNYVFLEIKALSDYGVEGYIHDVGINIEDFKY